MQHQGNSSRESSQQSHRESPQEQDQGFNLTATLEELAGAAYERSEALQKILDDLREAAR